MRSQLGFGTSSISVTEGRLNQSQDIQFLRLYLYEGANFYQKLDYKAAGQSGLELSNDAGPEIV